MTAVTGLRLHVDHPTDGRAVRRVDDRTLLVEDSDLLDPVLVADGVDRAVQALGLVEQHVVLGAALDRLADLVRVVLDLGDQRAVLGARQQV